MNMIRWFIDELGRGVVPHDPNKLNVNGHMEDMCSVHEIQHTLRVNRKVDALNVRMANFYGCKVKDLCGRGGHK